MNCINIFKLIKSKKDAKQLTSTQTTNTHDLVVKNTTIQTKPNTLRGKEKFEQENTEDSNRYYELMGMDINFEMRGKCKNKIQNKNSPKNKLKRGKMESFEERIQDFDNFPSKETEENFQSKDTVVPAYLSNQNQDLKQMSEHLYEQQTRIHEFQKITDTEGNYYYLLDFILANN